MINPKLIILVVIILAIFGMVMTRFSAPSSSLPKAIHQETAQESSQSAQEASPSALPVTGTINDLLALTTPQKCSFSSDQISWTVYVGNGKIRMDAGPSSYSSISSHMIADTQTSYFWTDTGFAIKINKPAAEATSSAATKSIPELNQKYTYSYQNWQLDPSLFVVPSNVTFKSLN